MSGIVTSHARPCVSPSVPRAPICRIAQPAWTPPATCHLVSVDSDLSPQRRHLSQDFRRTCAGDVSGTSSALLVMVTLSWSWGQGDKGRTPCHFGGRELRLQLVGHRPAHHGRRADRQTDGPTSLGQGSWLPRHLTVTIGPVISFSCTTTLAGASSRWTPGPCGLTLLSHRALAAALGRSQATGIPTKVQFIKTCF